MKYTSAQIQQMLDSPGVKFRTVFPVVINRDYDVPGFATTSPDGKTVYIDKDLFRRSDLGFKHREAVFQYAKLNKALVDLFRMHPNNARAIATRTYLKPYAGALLRYIKPIESPYIKNLPPNIDLSLYRPKLARQLTKRIKRATNRQELKNNRIKIYNQIAKTLDKDQKREYYKKLSGGRKQWK